MMAEINYHQPFYLLRNRTWRTWLGGKLLDEIEGKDSPADGHFPEDWLGSATRALNPGRTDPDEGIGKAQDKHGRTFTMPELFTISPDQSLGKAHVQAFGAQPQLLVKLLDSSSRLQIQAHPTVAWSKKKLNANSGKTEAWYILRTREPQSWVYMGFQQPPTMERWKEIIESQDLAAMERCFNPVPVSAGDVLLVEGGLPHAIGPGILMVEIQEPTDYVVRCEFDIPGMEVNEPGRTMGLGVDRVLDLFDYRVYPPETVRDRFGPRRKNISLSHSGNEVSLFSAPQTDRLELREVLVNGEIELSLDGRFSIFVVVQGEGVLVTEAGTQPVKQWDRLFFPAALERVQLNGNLKALRCLPPQPSERTERSYL